jgi:ribosomal protein S18 acetylase RimI-like enzyme
MAGGPLAAAAGGGLPRGATVRPFRLAHDLGAVTRLIDRAFAGESAEDRLTPGDVLALRLAAPLIGAVGLLIPAARDLFAGFVCERDGTIVGNVTIGRLGGDATRWMIGNVAVEAAYRRSGIGRQLMTAALQEIERRGGRITVLDVRADNEPASALYRSLGFVPIDHVAELRRPPRRDRPPRPASVRPLRAREWRTLAALLEAATPALVRRYMPVQDHQVMALALSAGLGAAGRVLGGSQTLVLVAERQGRVGGAVEIEVRGGETPHRLKLTIHPHARGAVEDDLVSGALAILPPGAIRGEARASETAAREALARAGFAPFRLLDRLAYVHSPLAT